MNPLARKLLTAVAVAVIVAPCAQAALPKRPRTAWLSGTTSYTNAERRPVDIRLIVIHVTEGPFWGSISWLQNQKAHASANFVVSRTGRIVQMVRIHDIAWHAGNWQVNTESVGIEHEGVTDSPAGFTLPEYRASARLVAWLATTCGIPIDRQHIIGHDEVPDPSDPTSFGGADHHTDPGSTWNWKLYMQLVRHYAYPVTPVQIGSTLRDGRALAGIAPWRAKVLRGKPHRVDFLVDGKLAYRDTRRPFLLRAWNTTHVTNGRHLLELRAFGRGTKDVWRGAVIVHNRPLVLKVTGIYQGRTVSGVLRLRALVQGAYGRHVALLVDGRQRARTTHRPYVFALDTRRLRDGYHKLVLVARARDGRVASRELDFLVVNGTAPKPKKPPVQAQIVAQSLADGQTVGGIVPWRVTIEGPVRAVRFFVDDQLRLNRTWLPFVYEWDTTKETPGPHALVVQGVRPDGSLAVAKLTVVVAQP